MKCSDDISTLNTARRWHGLSQVEFCRKQGLSLATLARYRKRQAEGSPADGNRWVAVKVSAGRAVLEGPASSGLAVALRSGRRIEVGHGFDTPTSVSASASPWRVLDERGREVAWANTFLDAERVRQVSLRSLRAYAYDLLHFARWGAERPPLSQTTESTLLDYARHQLDQEPKPAPQTINQRLGVLRCLYRFHYGQEIPAGQFHFQRFYDQISARRRPGAPRPDPGAPPETTATRDCTAVYRRSGQVLAQLSQLSRSRPRHQVCQRSRRRLLERRSLHAERPQNVACRLVLKSFAACPCHHIARQRISIIRIGRNIAAGKQPVGQRSPKPKTGRLGRPASRKQILEVIFESSPMCQQES
jgi:hypothetical protein